jgi:hypothetical protein
MAFIAGHIGPLPTTTADLIERVRAFETLPGEVISDYDYRVIPTAHGHLILRHKARHPVPPRLVESDDGTALALLGFTLTEPKDMLRTGARALDDCEGEFVAALADRNGLHLVNDRFATRPCYILRADDVTYFSSNLRFLYVLACQRYRPDIIGWLQVFTAAHTLGARTTAAGVQRLPPATHLTLTLPNRATERRYWRLEHQPETSLDPAAHSAATFAAFRAGAERRARMLRAGVLALSGGLDSRILAAALPSDSGFAAFTFVDARGAAGTPQTRAAAAVAAALKLPHRIEVLPSRVAEPADVLALTGGMRPYHHMALVMPYIAEIRRRGRAALLGGGPGDSLAGAFVPSAEFTDPARLGDCLRAAQRRRLARSALWPLVFRDDVIDASRRTVHEELANSFDAVSGPTAAHRVSAWAMVYRQSAFTFTSAMHTHPDVGEAFCHLDYRYVDLMLRLPASWLYKKTFYAYMIHRELPQLRHIPYANTGRRLTGHEPTLEASPDTLVARARVFGLRALRKAGRTILPRRAEPARWLVMGDSVLQDEVRDRLHAARSLHDVLDVRRCDDFLDKVRAGVYQDGAHEEILGGLVSICFAEGAN